MQFPFYTDRYYTKYCIRNTKRTEGNNYSILVHSNGLAILCVDPTHSALHRDPSVSPTLAIRYENPETKEDRLEQCDNISGKRKKNALRCNEGTILGVLVVTEKKIQ
eukprot:PhF_6_TR19681/c0_g1_i1/m.28731